MTVAHLQFPAAPLLRLARDPQRLGVTRRTWDRLARPGATIAGRIRADRYAAALGLHPMSIWGDLWLEETA